MIKMGKYKYLDKIISFDSSKRARRSSNILEYEFRMAKTNNKRERIMKATKQAEKRARFLETQKNLSREEKIVFGKIRASYTALYEQLEKLNNKIERYRKLSITD